MVLDRTVQTYRVSIIGIFLTAQITSWRVHTDRAIMLIGKFFIVCKFKLRENNIK